MSKGSKRNISFVQGDEPKFLQEFKQRAGYLAGPALEEKVIIKNKLLPLQQM